MRTVNLGQGMSSTDLATLLCLLVGAAFLWRLLSLTVHSKYAARSPWHTPASAPTAQPGVQLKLEWARDDADVDIIAIHGLDTKSPDTWIWKDKERKTPDVNWLTETHMLPSRVGKARIFTCDWPAGMFQPSDLIQKTDKEVARLLLNGIKNRHPPNSRTREDQPILFIASCLGGVMLMKALVMADCEYRCIRATTRGIVFLATPFGGTSFQDVAKWAEPGLRVRASFRGQELSSMLANVKKSVNIDELVRRFTHQYRNQLCRDPNRHQVMTFYELGKTTLYRKVLPWVPIGAKPLVDMSSATLQMVPHPLPLDRVHRMMNKFRGNHGDTDYGLVIAELEEILRNIRRKEADEWIREKHYTTERLRIERLSGDLLPIDQCYINLAIVEQSGVKRERSHASQSSPFSLFARQKVEAPDKTDRVDLATIFNEREGRDGRAIRPRRILVRGRAGVGKTTLCKRIVYDFTCGAQTDLHRSWTESFDRLLWIPLRHVKGRQPASYNHEDLFYHEYFCGEGESEGRRLAKELWQTVKDSHKTLFILDGLDEVSQELGGRDDMSRFLKDLLNQPNVIITSRPNATLPTGLRDVDLELETIGFFPDQVEDYIRNSFTHPQTARTDQEAVDHVKSFLRDHWLIQGLMRIPIQLDALCCIWAEFNSRAMPDTMTAIYRAIVQKLWKKDVLQLEKPSTAYVAAARPAEVERSVEAEIALIECLAFNGLNCDIIDYMPTHRDSVMQEFPDQLDLPVDEALARVSFLRTSDPLSKTTRDLNYHFLHLTFQEYFAAQYFVRCWRTTQPLQCLDLNSRGANQIHPIEFLQKQKYSARYDVFWRFVAGLLAAEGDKEAGADNGAFAFFQTIEREPLDLLGPTHQRLVMHCLSEVPKTMPLRQRLKDELRLDEKLKLWLLFECFSQQEAHLTREMEFPEQALRDALREGSDDARIIILKSLQGRPVVPISVNGLAPFWLRGDGSQQLKTAVLMILRIDTCLTGNVLRAVVQGLDADGWLVREAALRVLEKQTSLSDDILEVIVRRLDDDYADVRVAALHALQERMSQSDDVLAAVVRRLDDEDENVQCAAVAALGQRTSLSNAILRAIVCRLDHHANLRYDAVMALRKQTILSKPVLRAIVRRLDDDGDVQIGAVHVLQKRKSLPDTILRIIVQRLDDWNARWSAAHVLQEQMTLSNAILGVIVQRFDNDDWCVRQAALRLLEKRTSLPDDIIEPIVRRLNDDHADVRWAAVLVMREQMSSSDDILRVIVKGLDADAWRVREASLRVLEKRRSLSDDILEVIVRRLDDDYADVRVAALHALQERTSQSDDVLAAVVRRLDDSDENVRWAAVLILREMSSSDDISQIVAQGLDDEERDVRQVALEVLQKWTSCSYNHILEAIVQRLDDEERYLRQVALEVLQKWTSSYEEILEAIMQRLDEDEDVQQVTLEVLQKWTSSYEEILEAIVQRLDDEDEDVRWSAVRFLEERTRLPKNILMAVARQLESSTAGNAAEAVLRKQEKFYHTILGGAHVGSLFQVLFRGAFGAQWSMYLDHESICVNLPDSIRVASMDDTEVCKDLIKKARPQGAPATATWLRVKTNGGDDWEP